MTATSLRAARFATCAIFLISGIGIASWAPMVPFARTRLQLNDAELGLILLALGTGAMVAMPMTGLLIRRFGSRATALGAIVVFSATMPLLAIAPTSLLLAASLFVFGMGVGAVGVAMNAQAVLVEQWHEVPIMSSFHGLFSVGGLTGSLGMSLLLGHGWNLATCATLVGVLALAIGLWQFPYLLPRAQDAPADGPQLALPHGRVVMVGILCFICFLAEGALLDWSAIFLRFFRGFPPAEAGMGYAVFSVAMALGRLTGDRVVHAVGPVPTVRFGALLAAGGYFAVVLLPSGAGSIVGFAMIGLGISNVVPLLFSTAGRMASPAIALPAVTTMGYAGLLSGPALIGFVSHATSLALALGAVGVALLAVAGSARIVRR